MATAARALADPIRRRVLDLLVERPLRTHEIAAETGMSAAALSRHLGVLRAARLVDRVDVDHDGRGREYRLVSDGLGSYARWLSGTWAASLSVGQEPAAAVLLARLGAFLDAFSARDVDFFRRHLDEQVLLVFPDMPEPVDKQGCLDSVADHPTWQRYDIDPEPTVHTLGAHSLICTMATVRHDADRAARRVAITAVFAENDPWTLLHLQWTNARPNE
jgi:DNA-binding transcriptional ArsR family regulator